MFHLFVASCTNLFPFKQETMANVFQLFSFLCFLWFSVLTLTSLISEGPRRYWFYSHVNQVRARRRLCIIRSHTYTNSVVVFLFTNFFFDAQARHEPEIQTRTNSINSSTTFTSQRGSIFHKTEKSLDKSDDSMPFDPNQQFTNRFNLSLLVFIFIAIIWHFWYNVTMSISMHGLYFIRGGSDFRVRPTPTTIAPEPTILTFHFFRIRDLSGFADLPARAPSFDLRLANPLTYFFRFVFTLPVLRILLKDQSSRTRCFKREVVSNLASFANSETNGILKTWNTTC